MGITVGVVKPDNSNGGGGSTPNNLIEIISIENQQEYELPEGTVIQSIFFNKALCLPNEYEITLNVVKFLYPDPMTAGDSIAIISAVTE
ncbi:hypothetical protein [Flavobacterium sp.]|uniref:hypothetical protein n=1 Tax=Flavobacterium sp. TaxID=239 RepID=UPI00391A34D3